MAYGDEETGGSAKRVNRSTGPESALVGSTKADDCLDGPGRLDGPGSTGDRYYQ